LPAYVTIEQAARDCGFDPDNPPKSHQNNRNAVMPLTDKGDNAPDPESRIFKVVKANYGANR
jgi:hypothetical protein